MAHRAPDLHAFQRPIRRPDHVLVLDLRGKPASSGTMAVQVPRAVQEHHFFFHFTPPVRRVATNRRGGGCWLPDRGPPAARRFLLRARDTAADTPISTVRR